MKKQAILFFSVIALLVSSCKKDSTTPNNSSPYYFKGNLNGTSYNLNANFPQYMSFFENEIGGYEVGSVTSLFPSFGLRLSWPVGDTVKESDMASLTGKTLYFSDTSLHPHPELNFDSDFASDTWYSEDTADVNYSVKIISVSFLKDDISISGPVKTYVIKGTCSAVMSQTSNPSILSGGEFNFVIARRDY